MTMKTTNTPARIEPDAPIARDEMDKAAFDAMMSEGLAQAKAGQGFPLEEAFHLLHEDV